MKQILSKQMSSVKQIPKKSQKAFHSTAFIIFIIPNVSGSLGRSAQRAQRGPVALRPPGPGLSVSLEPNIGDGGRNGLLNLGPVPCGDSHVQKNMIEYVNLISISDNICLWNLDAVRTSHPEKLIYECEFLMRGVTVLKH